MRWLVLAGSLVAGLLIGSGAGMFLGAKPEVTAAKAADPKEMHVHAEVQTDFDYIRMNSQFVIPLVASGKVKSLVALSLSLEVQKGSGDVIFAREPKIRDVFLRVLFDHANSGGFEGEFTAGGTLASLRRALTEAGRQVVGPVLQDVLITDIARQDS